MQARLQNRFSNSFSGTLRTGQRKELGKRLSKEAQLANHRCSEKNTKNGYINTSKESLPHLSLSYIIY